MIIMTTSNREHQKASDRFEYSSEMQSSSATATSKRPSGDKLSVTSHLKSSTQDSNQRKRKSLSKSQSPHVAKKQKSSANDNVKKKKKHKKERKSESKNKLRKEVKQTGAKSQGHATLNDNNAVDKGNVVTLESRQKSNKPEEQNENCYSASDNESELNLEKPMYRIIDYIDNRKELCHQTFKTLRGRKLRGMIPEVLRPYSLIQLRNMCLSELEGMSRKRILRILNGDKPDVISSSSSSTSGEDIASSESESESASSSSSSDSVLSRSAVTSASSDSSSSSMSTDYPTWKARRNRRNPKKSGEKRRREKEKLSSTPEAVVDSTCKLEEPTGDEIKISEKEIPGSNEECPVKADAEKKEENSEDQVDQDVLVVSAADLNQDFDSELTGRNPLATDPNGNPLVASSSTNPDTSRKVCLNDEGALAAVNRHRVIRTQMEIFELEMRARAIRSMLDAQEAKNPRQQLKKS